MNRNAPPSKLLKKAAGGEYPDKRKRRIFDAEIIALTGALNAFLGALIVLDAGGARRSVYKHKLETIQNRMEVFQELLDPDHPQRG